MYVYRPAHCAVRVLYYLLCLNTFTNTTSGCVNTCCANTQPAVPNSQDLSPKSDKACHRYHSTDCCGCHKQQSDGVTHHTTHPAFFSAKQELILQIRDTLTCCVILHAMQDDTEHTVAIYTHLCVRCNITALHCDSNPELPSFSCTINARPKCMVGVAAALWWPLCVVAEVCIDVL